MDTKIEVIDEEATPLLSLPKTGIKVDEKEFWREDDKGNVMMRFPVTDIQSIDFSRPINPVTFVFLGVAVALIGIGWKLSETNWLSCTLYVLAVPVIAISLLGMRHDRLTVTRRSGAKVTFDCDETADIVEQFKMSLEDSARK